MINKAFHERIFLVLILNIFRISCLMVVLERSREYCIIKDIEAGDTLKFSYMVSGEKEDSINVQLMENEYKLLYSNKDPDLGFKDSDDFSYDVLFRNSYKLCFVSNSPKETVVSFEYFTLKESGHILNLAKTEVFEDMYKNVSTISLLFEEIDKNMKFFIERRETHSRILNHIISTVKSLSVYKIIVIIMVSISQIYLITKLFKGKRVDIGDPFNDNDNL